VDDYGVIVTANGTEVWAQFGAVTDQPRALDVGTAVKVEYYPKPRSFTRAVGWPGTAAEPLNSS
jgi:hypothetical protein